MHVMTGWSGEVRPSGWDKAEVHLDEGDLVRILVDNGLPADTYVPLNTAFQLLEGEAERLMWVKLAARQSYPVDDARLKISKQNGVRDALIASLRGTEEPD